jgi:predicted transcriptional regulator
MNRKQIIKTLRGYFDREFRLKLEELSSTRKLLKKLKQKRKALEGGLGDAEGAAARTMEQQIAVLRAQEKKAIKLIKKG